MCEFHAGLGADHRSAMHRHDKFLHSLVILPELNADVPELLDFSEFIEIELCIIGPEFVVEFLAVDFKISTLMSFIPIFKLSKVGV